MAGPQVGDPAPDFQLEGTEGTFRLADQRGKRVVLLFYPHDGTPVCTRQFCSYRDDPEGMSSLDAVVVGISTKDVESKRRFAESNDLNVPLLADEDASVAAEYGNKRFGGVKRSVVIVDGEGVIRHRHDHALGLDFETADEIKQALAAIPAI